MLDDEVDLAELVLDPDRSVDERLSAAQQLAETNVPAAVETLMEVVERTSESEDVYQAAGGELGRLASRFGGLSEFDMRDMAGSAYKAYCDASR
jgi:hypothetical protein